MEKSDSPKIEECLEVVPDPPEKQISYSAFTNGRRKLILFIVTFAGFLGPTSGNIYIPLLPLLQRVFNVSTTSINATVSVFMAVFAVAPLFWASWADFGGRKTLYIISLFFFILANLLLAVVPANIGALFVLRILQAFGASSVMSVGAGSIADITEPKRRATAISYFLMGPQLGPILGPILSLIATDGQWRWIFGFLTIIGSIVYLMILFLLPETLRYLVGRGDSSKGWFVKPKLFQKRTATEEFPKPPKPSLRIYWKLLKFTPLLLCSLNGGFLFASFYGVSITFARVLQIDYGLNVWQTSISYICPGIAMISGSLFAGRLLDKISTKIIKEHGKHIPEKRFSLQVIGLIISMAGMVGYGWCVQKHTHLAPIYIMVFLAGFGMTWVFVGNTTYLTECSTGQPATNVAIGNVMRNASAAISSAIIDKVISRIGFGWSFTIFGFIDLVGIGIVLVLMRYGQKMRENFELNR
ncbi:dityrosine transporter A(acid, azole) Q(quinidine) Resistance [Scheffersomyces stipitis CBS 6054]|uniref:Dityrosine transporter A(Acid, azole) Q(Quinidine) Resistance n=1 Tax=Scheffersomyces stipitis (strain ATCC 58785 / CBS 6054 / NBRC 10063 / NRRL Y-11545) TaxID=322104 RepID=A3LP70_PICST|nr:dityrosine transporter A(acid, azole) Q(quinidine) Resistance [Scheffersomyces stipitis CBS 6054]ABN64445.2 dityrosine transporter A(acid, azole) Q(quinidine) Resistance [Scheffersomyces stipitis CBS 6054]